MARCQVRRSLRNRLFRAVLPFAHAWFAVQDVIYRLLGLDHSWLITTPPSVPISEAAPYAPMHGYFLDRHGDSLFYRAWPPVGSAAACAVVIAFDGLGSHSRQFHPLGPALAPRGIALIGLDLPGHGLSEGPRGDLAYLPAMLDGIADAVSHFSRTYPNAPVYLLGESIGGTMALQLAARSGQLPALAGLILSSVELEPTNLSAKGAVASLFEILRQLPYLFVWSHARSVGIAGREKLVARGPEVYQHSKVDPLRNNHVSVRTMVYAFELILSTPFWARRARLPTLILQAACDRVSDPEAATSLLGCLATGDKELVYFPGAAHGLFYDQDTPEVLRVIADWLERHYSRWQSPAQPGPNCGQQPAA